jgi:glyoxylase-like metal-dependent hydrolase (beta-lactamase superfamily II)
MNMKPIRLELPTPFDVGPVNAYLFVEPEMVLVDTGVNSAENWTALQAGLAQHELTVADLQRIIITHPHIDHCGQAARLVAESEADIWIADMGLDWLVHPQAKWQARIAYYRDHFLPEVGMAPELIQMSMTYLEHTAASAVPVPRERIVTFQVGDSLSLGGVPWQVLHMPGHASTQTCFYQPDTRQFLSADMLLTKTPTPVVERPSDGQNRIPALPIFLQSLDVVHSLQIDVVYPGHGQPFGDHRLVVQRQKERITQRKAQTLSLITQGHHTPVELVDIMYASYPLQFRFAGLWMLVGYLDLLKAEAAIEERRVGGVLHYYEA